MLVKAFCRGVRMTSLRSCVDWGCRMAMGNAQNLAQNHPHLHDARAAILGRQRELNLSIDATRTQESGVEDVDAVGGCHYLDCLSARETVELKVRAESGGMQAEVGMGLDNAQTEGSEGGIPRRGTRTTAHPRHSACHATPRRAASCSATCVNNAITPPQTPANVHDTPPPPKKHA